MNWDWFYALYSLSAIFMVVGVLYKIVIFVLAIFSLIFNDKIRSLFNVFIMILPMYFLASYTVLVGLGVKNGDKSIFILVLGGLFLILYELMGIREALKKMEESYDIQTMKLIKYRYIGLALGVIYYIYAIFDPRPALTKVIFKLSEFLQWIQDIPIIGWIIAGCAFVYTLYMILMGIGMIFGIMTMIISKIVHLGDPKRVEL